MKKIAHFTIMLLYMLFVYYLNEISLNKHQIKCIVYCIRPLIASKGLCPEATVISVWKTPVCKWGVCKWGILKCPVSYVLNFRGWIKCIFDTVN